MKYLKLFEDHEGEMFWEISIEHLFKKVWNSEELLIRVDFYKNWINFTDTELEVLREILNGFEFRAEVANRQVPIRYAKAQIFISSETEYVDTMITKTQDEWFYVVLQSKNLIYECDQFDGLIACLEYLKGKYQI